MAFSEGWEWIQRSSKEILCRAFSLLVAWRLASFPGLPGMGIVEVVMVSQHCSLQAANGLKRLLF
jgi:hypothetical protein